MPGYNRFETTAVHLRRVRLVQALIDGRTYDDIANDPEFGYNGNAGAARKDFTRTKRAAIATEREVAELWTQQQIARLEYYLECLDDRVSNGEPRAIEVAVKVCERIAKLQGLDAPIKAEVTIDQAEDLDAELQEMIAEAKAQVAAEEAQLRGDA